MKSLILALDKKQFISVPELFFWDGFSGTQYTERQRSRAH